ncbi:MAG: radical SAM protein [Candidatus Omnitrophica bacterium]|nr:radical SAM protein [Candidatus Omnitrophota bacterium]
MNIEGKINKIEPLLEALNQRLKTCDICPRNCYTDRLAGQKGYCGGGKDMALFTAFLHCGEEPAISGENGSGTVFFSGCNLKCIYCQNYEFSQIKKGKLTTIDKLTDIMLGLEKDGAHNINLVTPTHFLPQILKSLYLALKRGLKIPIVYNTSGYEKKEVISQLEGVVDIYLTDLRYLNSELAKKYSNAEDYPMVATESIKEMYRQYPQAIWDEDILKQGTIVRHLVLPGYLSESKKVLNWIKDNTPKVLPSVMFQYQPYFKANTYPEINRPINKNEYKEIKQFVEELGLEGGWIQEFGPQSDLAGVHFKADQKDSFI